MDNKKIVMILFILVVSAAVIVNVLSSTIGGGGGSYISAEPEKVGYKEVSEYLERVNFDDKSSKKYFGDKVVNKYTLKYFKFLQMKFKKLSYEDHLSAVRKYLMSVLDSEEAGTLYELYRKYLEYEKFIAGELNGMNDLKTTEDFLNVLKKMRKVQVQFFGEKYADILYGPLLKAQEYPIRRAAIVNDENMYGSEKMDKIKKLNTDMWAEEGSNVENSRKPYIVYTEKMSIYSKDLSEMSDEQKVSKIREFRNSTFPPEVVERLEKVDQELALDKERDITYKEKYDDLVNDSSLNEEEKKEKINSLQNEIYGKNSDSLRRREAMNAGKSDLMKSLGK